MVWSTSKQQGGDQEEPKQHKMVKEVKKSETPIFTYQLPFHSLSLNKVKNIEVDRLRLSFTTAKNSTLVPVDSGSDEESDEDQGCSDIDDTVNSIGGQMTVDKPMDEGLDRICSGLHAIPRKNKARSAKKRSHKLSSRKFYKIFS
ncbi:hypothetical protein CFC21_057003 [Triticum aestivum]|uniref:Uncharacterized protein n=3 Tax=Triticum TaxID=4564 RepID=A0A9R0SXM5_TRITD|nr:uncharacterized protein LOC123094602 [Triticum aestivum]KAF7048199.1 hypothetical protein CFC21_057003 [Triticum aestivum]VAI03371.1 unnamed protein product [Triticum turgidum subsp. durum]